MNALKIISKKYNWKVVVLFSITIIILIVSIIIINSSNYEKRKLKASIYKNDIRINEFMAANSSIIEAPDKPGLFPDWIELYNQLNFEVDISGLYLTDNFANPTKFRIPDGITIPAGGYQMFWADGNLAAGGCHTNFKLNKEGEEIVLVDRDGITLIDKIIFSDQKNDISTGRLSGQDDKWYHFDVPSPGQLNEVSTSRVVITPVTGSYSGPIRVTLSSDIPDSTIYYSFGGWDPQTSQEENSYEPPCYYYDPQIYTGAFVVDTTVSIIARAVAPGYCWSVPSSATYLIDEKSDFPVCCLMTREPGGLWNTPDLEPFYHIQPPSDHKRGIYHNPQGRGKAWERPVDLIYFPDLENENIIYKNIGLRIHGNSTRSYLHPKHYFRIYFPQEAPFNNPIFPGNPVSSFRRLIMGAKGCPWHSCDMRQLHLLITEQIFMDIAREFGVKCPFSTHIRLFVNGTDWGIYNISERVDRYYMKDHFNSRKDLIQDEIKKEDAFLKLAEYINHSISNLEKKDDSWFIVNYSDDPEGEGGYLEIKEGGNAAFAAWSEVTRFWHSHDLAIPDNYDYFKNMIDINSFTRWIIVTCYLNDIDYLENFYFARRSAGGDTRWFLIPWDPGPALIGESSILKRTIEDDEHLPLGNLLRNPEYRVYFLNMFKSLMNGTGSSRSLLYHIEEWESRLEDELYRTVRTADIFCRGKGLTKWDAEKAIHNWKKKLKDLKKKAQNRPDTMKNCAGGLWACFSSSEYDADKDGYNDYKEIFIHGTNPLNPYDHPESNEREGPVRQSGH